MIYKMKENVDLKIILDLKGCVCGLTVKDKEDKTIEFKDLSYRTKIKVINCFRQYYDCLVRFLKEK